MICGFKILAMDDYGKRKMNAMSESDESLLIPSAYDTSSPTVEEAQNEENATQNNTPLKKGPWTSSEDDILVEYIRKNGEGNWNAVQRNTGLARCGKSCRLRWTNHLKPDLKKGAFTPEEEMLVVRLHARMGNKWARMALELPGRTDNEIKNYWNTRAKKRKREGLGLYPSDLCLEPSNENGVSDPSNPRAPIEGRNPPTVNEAYDFPLIEFKAFDPNQYLLTMSDFHPSTSTPRDFRSFYKGRWGSNACPPGRLCGSGPVSPCPPRPPGTQILNGSGYPQIQENLGCCLDRVITPPSSMFLVGNASKNGGIACSSELPSFQKHNGTPLPPFVSDYTFAPPFEEPIFTTRNNELLDEVVRGSSRADYGSLDAVIRGPLQANDGSLESVIRGPSRAMNFTNADCTNTKDSKEMGLEKLMSSPPSIFSVETPHPSLDDSASGDDLIFPEINLDGLEMPGIDDGDDLFSAIDCYYSFGPRDTSTNDSSGGDSNV